MKFITNMLRKLYGEKKNNNLSRGKLLKCWKFPQQEVGCKKIAIHNINSNGFLKNNSVFMSVEGETIESVKKEVKRGNYIKSRRPFYGLHNYHANLK